MKIIDFFRDIKRKYSDLKYRWQMNKLSKLIELVENNPDLKSISVNSGYVAINLTSGLTFEWNPYERNSCLGLAQRNNYEHTEMELLKNLLDPCDVIFDIGANFGYFSISVQKAFPLTRVYSFEPIPTTFRLLKRNLEYNNLESTFSYNIGFSDRTGYEVFYLPAKLGDAWASMGKGVASVLKYKLTEVQCMISRLDDFIKEHTIERLDFIKCDVEGAEKLVLDGAVQTLIRDKPTMMLEIGDNWSAYFGYNRQMLIHQICTYYDYECYGVMGEQVIPIIEADDVLQYREDRMYNYFFIHPSNRKHASLIQKYIKK